MAPPSAGPNNQTNAANGNAQASASARRIMVTTMTRRRMLLATAALCMCSLIHAFLLISVFPYAGYMVMDLIPNLTPERAGPYAGFLSSAFMAGRAMSSYPWGRLADWYGRKFVLVASLGLSALCSLLFGMSQSFVIAMIWRFLLGLSNGIVGTVKTVVSELAAQQDDDDNNNNNHHSGLDETKMMGLVVGMRAWGFLISPAVGGWLAEPVQQYPTLFAGTTSVSEFIREWLSHYPFLLPNLVGGVICMGAALLVAVCIPETLPQHQLQGLRYIPGDTVQYIRQMWKKFSACCRHKENQKFPEYDSLLENGPHHSTAVYTSSESSRKLQEKEPGLKESEGSDTSTANNTKTTTTMAGLWENRPTRDHLIPYWFFSLVVVCLDEAFPLFCISTKGGLSLSEAGIGKILSMAGLFFAMCQYAVYVATVDRFGLYPSLSIGSLLGFFPVLFIPFSLVLSSPTVHHNDDSTVTEFDHSSDDSSSQLTWPSFLLLMTIMAVSKIFCCMFFTSMSIALNKTVEASQRASLNGLATIGGSIAKGIGPIVAGFLVTASFSSILVPAKYGSIIIFTCIGIMGLATLGYTVRLKPPS